MASPAHSNVPHWRTDGRGAERRQEQQHVDTYGSRAFHLPTGKPICGAEQDGGGAHHYPEQSSRDAREPMPYQLNNRRRSPALDAQSSLISFASAPRHTQAGYESVLPPSADELEREWFAAHGQAPPACTPDIARRGVDAPPARNQASGHAERSPRRAYAGMPDANGRTARATSEQYTKCLAPLAAPRLASTSPVYPSARPAAISGTGAAPTPPTAYADMQQGRPFADEQLVSQAQAQGQGSAQQQQPYVPQRHQHAPLGEQLASGSSSQAGYRQEYAQGGQRVDQQQVQQATYYPGGQQHASRSPVLPKLQIHRGHVQRASERGQQERSYPDANASSSHSHSPSQAFRPAQSHSAGPSQPRVVPPSQPAASSQPTVPSSSHTWSADVSQQQHAASTAPSSATISVRPPQAPAPQVLPTQALNGLSARIAAAARLASSAPGSTVQRPWATPSPAPAPGQSNGAAHAGDAAPQASPSTSTSSTLPRAPPLALRESAPVKGFDAPSAETQTPAKLKRPRKPRLGPDGLPLPPGKPGRKPKSREPDRLISTELVAPPGSDVQLAQAPGQGPMPISALIHGKIVPDIFKPRRGRPSRAIMALREQYEAEARARVPRDTAAGMVGTPPPPQALARLMEAAAPTAPMQRTDSVERQEREDVTAALIALSDSNAADGPPGVKVSLANALRAQNPANGQSPDAQAGPSSLPVGAPGGGAPRQPATATSQAPRPVVAPTVKAAKPPPSKVPTANDHLSQMLKEWDQLNAAEAAAKQTGAEDEQDYETERKKTIQENERLMRLLGLGSNDGLGVDEVVQFAGRRGRKPGSKNKVPRRRRLAEVGSGDEAAPLAVTSTRKRKRIRFDYVEVPQRKSVRFLESFHFEPLPPVPENPILRAMDVDAGSDDVEAAGQGSREYQESTGSLCHQCHRKNELPKMRCRNKDPVCESAYCSSCVRARYTFFFDEEDRTFICPKCEGYCNCSLCLKRNGMLSNIADFSVAVAKRDGPVQAWLEAMGTRPMIPPERRIHCVRFVHQAEDAVSPALPPHVMEQLSKMIADAKRTFARKKRAKRQPKTEGEVSQRVRKPKARTDPDAPGVMDASGTPGTPDMPAGDDGGPSKRRRKVPKNCDYSARLGVEEVPDSALFTPDGQLEPAPPKPKRKYVRKAPRPAPADPNADVYAALNMPPPPPPLPPKNVDSDGDTIEGMDEAEDGPGWDRGYASDPIPDEFVLSFARPVEGMAGA